MLVQTLIQNHETMLEDGINSLAEDRLLENTQAIVLIDLGLCGVDGWSCFDMDHNRLNPCQD